MYEEDPGDEVEITPQYHETRQQMGDSRHNFTIHATIPRFTPQFHDSHHKEADSHHKETADRPRSQYWLNSLFPAFLPRPQDGF